jgi:DNA-3-methyladenine glycosylase I
MSKQRCEWCLGDELYVKYHDEEWGVPVYDDQLLFEYLILEGAQAGLSWQTILNKRENYRIAFDQFDVEKIALYDDKKTDELLSNKGIVRNKLKIKATINNAQQFLKMVKIHGSFKNYIWQFVNHQPILNQFSSIKELPATTPISDDMSKQLKRDGFKFVGSTICYAYMQAVGMVNDHVESCFKYPTR